VEETATDMTYLDSDEHNFFQNLVSLIPLTSFVRSCDLSTSVSSETFSRRKINKKNSLNKALSSCGRSTKEKI
jgi:hypothetical protein